MFVRQKTVALFCKTMLCATMAIAALGQEIQAPDWPAIRLELEAMYKTDQAKRLESNAMKEAARAKGIDVDRAAAATLWSEIKRLDQENQGRVASIVDQHGWPKQSVIGATAVQAAWLIVQHADLDYQLKYLPLIRSAASAGEISKPNVALLEDRVLLRQAKPQRYGSQVDTKNGVSLLPVEDEASLDARRAEMDLEPICSYLKRFVKAYGEITYPACAKNLEVTH